MKYLEMYDKLARFCEEDIRLGGIEYRQIEIITKFVVKESVAELAHYEAVIEAAKELVIVERRNDYTSYGERHEIIKASTKQTRRRHRESGGDEMTYEEAMKPSIGLLVKLGSLAVHTEEILSPNGHAFDKSAIQTLLDDPEVKEWLAAMDAMSFLPKKR